MKHPQIGTIGCEDLIFAQQKSVQITKELSRAKVKEKTEREKLERNRAVKTSELSSIIGSEKLDEKDDSVVIEDPDYIPPRGRKPKKHSTVMLELHRKDLVKDAASICARLKLSNTAITTLYARIIVSGGGDLKDFVMSKATTWRHRIAGEKEAEKS